MQKITASARSLIWFVPYALVGAVHLIALFVGASDVAVFTKPLLMTVLLAGFLFALPQWRSEVALFGSLGLLFSWLGDTSLMYSGNIGFLLGLGFFLLAHVAYLTMFIRKLKKRAMPLVAIAYVVWWIALVAVLAPHTGVLLGPVAVYGVVLGAMAAVALRSNRWIALGGMLFVISDTVLGLNKFVPEFTLWQVGFVVMVTYISAQGLIAYGVVQWAVRQQSTGESVSKVSTSA